MSDIIKYYGTKNAYGPDGNLLSEDTAINVMYSDGSIDDSAESTMLTLRGMSEMYDGREAGGYDDYDTYPIAYWLAN